MLKALCLLHFAVKLTAAHLLTFQVLVALVTL